MRQESVQEEWQVLGKKLCHKNSKKRKRKRKGIERLGKKAPNKVATEYARNYAEK